MGRVEENVRHQLLFLTASQNVRGWEILIEIESNSSAKAGPAREATQECNQADFESLQRSFSTASPSLF